MNISDGDNFILDFCIFQSIKSDRGMKNERTKEKQNYSNLKSTNLCRMYFFFFFDFNQFDALKRSQYRHRKTETIYFDYKLLISLLSPSLMAIKISFSYDLDDFCC
ncbi:WD repeat-containing protein 59 [Sarcoptes scabiei]|nr:WD repeat-containing protein 59 [Sarcoptes scabiei]